MRRSKGNSTTVSQKDIRLERGTKTNTDTAIYSGPHSDHSIDTFPSDKHPGFAALQMMAQRRFNRRWPTFQQRDAPWPR